MTAALLPPQVTDTADLLLLERTDITFSNLTPEEVQIEITLRNRGTTPSVPTAALVQAAPLGAFLPWRPLVVLPVPALAPGESVVLRARARRPLTTPLGDPDRLTPAQLLTALDPDGPPPGDGHQGRRRPFRESLLAAAAGGVAELPADPFQLLARGGAHWAGNLNVFLGGKSVERHLARALRIYPGRTNVAIFFVGSGPDHYAFRMAGAGADWEAALFDASRRTTLAMTPHGCAPVAENTWVQVERQSIMLLALNPPEHCTQGAVEVHVEQRSTGKTAIVEFSLDPRAQGPGCFVVS